MAAVATRSSGAANSVVTFQPKSRRESNHLLFVLVLNTGAVEVCGGSFGGNDIGVQAFEKENHTRSVRKIDSVAVEVILLVAGTRNLLSRFHNTGSHKSTQVFTLRHNVTYWIDRVTAMVSIFIFFLGRARKKCQNVSVVCPSH
jgi:hypothetical protein